MAGDVSGIGTKNNRVESEIRQSFDLTGSFLFAGAYVNIRSDEFFESNGRIFPND